MWVARVLERSDEYMRRRTCLSCKAANSKKLLPAPPIEKRASHLLLVAFHLNHILLSANGYRVSLIGRVIRIHDQHIAIREPQFKGPIRVALHFADLATKDADKTRLGQWKINNGTVGYELSFSKPKRACNTQIAFVFKVQIYYTTAKA
jgi:hypothetical protein